MSKKKTFSYAAAAVLFAAAGMSPQQAWAQELTSYENEVLAADFATVAPEGNFSIQAELAKGQVFSMSTKAGLTFSYAAERPGMHSFLVDVTARTVDVYLVAEKVTTVSLAETTLVGGDDRVKGTNLVKGDIYAASNLLKNPGFETYASFTAGDESTIETTTDTRGVPAEWNIMGGWRTQNTKMNDGYAVIKGQVEGYTALMMHNGTGFLSQDISGLLKANTWYKAQWRQIGHFDTSPVTVYDAYILKDSAVVAEDGANIIAKYEYNSSDKSDKGAGVANWVDPVFAFTAAEMPEKVFFLVGKHATNTINHFDCMTLQEITAGDIVFNGITYSGELIRWEDGLTVPEGGAAVIYEDVTEKYMVNPGFEENVDAVTQIRPEDEAIITGGWKNRGVWQPYGWTVEYGVSNEWDQGFLSTGTQYDQQDPPHKAIAGITAAAEGERFYYFRSRWVGDQSFSISQEMKQLQPGVYNLEFMASRTESDHPVTVSVGNKSVELEGSGTGFAPYSLTLNVLNPSNYTVKVSSVKNGEDKPIALAIDGFRLVYRGDADEAAALEEAIQNVNSLYDQLYNESQEGIWPSGVQALYITAEDLYFGIDESDIDNVTAILQALEECRDSAAVAAPVFKQLSDNFNYVAELLKSNFDDGGALQAAWEEAREIISARENDESYFATECAAADAKLLTAIRPYVLAGTATATETAPYVITDVDKLQTVVSAPHFTKPLGDKTLNTDRIKGNWVTNNNPVSSGQYKLHTAGGLNCWNNWENNFTSMDVYQEITNLPEGMYSIRAKHATNGAISDQHAYVQSKTGLGVSNVPTVVYEGTAFETECQWEQVGETEKVYVEEGGTLRIGFASTCGGGTSGWFCFTDVEVLYYTAPAGALADALNKQKEEVSAYLTDPENAPAIMGAEKALANAAIAKADAAASKDEMIAAAGELIIAMDTMKYSVEQYGAFQLDLDEAKYYITDEAYPAAARATFEAAIKAIEKDLVDGAADETVSAAVFATKKTELDAALEELENSFENAMIIEGEKRIEGASETNPVDLTDFIVNAAIDDAPADLKTKPNGWTCELANSGNNQYTNNNEHYTGVAGNSYLDAWNGTKGALKYTASQTIMLPNGKYIIKCVARADGDGAYLFAKTTQSGLVTAAVVNNGSTGGSIWENAEEGSELKNVNPDGTTGLGRGFGWGTYEVRVNVIDNQLTLGVSNNTEVTKGNAWAGTWFSADEFQLICVEKGWHVGIEDVDADEAELKVYVENGYIIVEGAEDYTITSVNGAVATNVKTQFAPGVYVVKAGGKVAKVMVP